MTIIIRIGPAVIEVFWALIALLGVVLISSGSFTALSGFTNFGTMSLVNEAAISHLTAGILTSLLGLGVGAAGYLGIRGRIIITTVKEPKTET